MKKPSLTLISVTVSSLSLAAITVLAPVHAHARNGQTGFADDVVPISRDIRIVPSTGGEGYNAGELDLTSYDGLMKGTKFGAMLIQAIPTTAISSS